MGKIQIMWRKYKYGIIVVSIIVIFLLLIIFFVYRKEDIIALSTIAIAIVTLVYASLTYLILDEQKSERTINFINNEIKPSVIDSIFEQYYKNKGDFEEGKITTYQSIGFKQFIEDKIKPDTKNTVYFDIIYSYYFKKYFPYTYSNIEKYEEKLKLYYENVEKIFEPIAKKFGIEKGEDTYYKAVHVAVYRDKKVTYEDIKKDFPSQCEEYENIKDELKKLKEYVLSSLKKEIKIYTLSPPVVILPTRRAR